MLVDVPDPVSIQWNRFYSRELFLQVKPRLRPGVVFSWPVRRRKIMRGCPEIPFLAGMDGHPATSTFVKPQKRTV